MACTWLQALQLPVLCMVCPYVRTSVWSARATSLASWLWKRSHPMPHISEARDTGPGTGPHLPMRIGHRRSNSGLYMNSQSVAMAPRQSTMTLPDTSTTMFAHCLRPALTQQALSLARIRNTIKHQVPARF